MMQNVIGQVKRAEALLNALEALGYRFGPPLFLTTASVQADAIACHALRCTGCKRKGLEYQPAHRGQSYRVVAVCSRCGAEEEM